MKKILYYLTVLCTTFTGIASAQETGKGTTDSDWSTTPSIPSAPDAPFTVLQPGPQSGARERELIRPSFQSASLDILLQDYAQRTGKVLIRDPRLANVNITLVNREPIPVEEYLRAVESLLAMNNISLIPFRDQFLKVVPADSAVRSGITLNLEGIEELPEVDGVVTQLIQLRFLDVPEIQALITDRLSPTAKVQQIERNNSLLVTDTQSNLRRILEILTLIDQHQTVREELLIYSILFATASEIKSRLEELIAQSQADLERQRVQAAGTVRTQVRAPPGVIRPGGATTTAAPAAAPSPAGGETISSPGLIRSRVQMVADDRTNILLIISRPENHTFFEGMISTMDKKVDPEITVKVHSLQFASAEDVSATLNDLIGAVTHDAAVPSQGAPGGNGAEARTGQTIRDFIQQRNAERELVSEPAGRSNIGEISPNTRILPDQRTNSLLMMGRNADLAVLEEVIAQLDRMLPQVQVRAVIMEVNLNDNFSCGIEWLQRSLTGNNLQTVDGVPVRTPIEAFGGGQRRGEGPGFRDGATVDQNVELPEGSLTYFTTFFDLNLDMVLRFAEDSSDSKVIDSPVIMTTDNTEARIQVGERRAVSTTSATTTGGAIQSQMDFVNSGIDLTVTPRINPQGVVLMEIAQCTRDVGGVSIIDGNEPPNFNTRQLNASLAIPSGGMLVLGGLVREDDREAINSTTNVRTELLVLISPEVILTPEEAESLTHLLKAATKL